MRTFLFAILLWLNGKPLTKYKWITISGDLFRFFFFLFATRNIVINAFVLVIFFSLFCDGNKSNCVHNVCQYAKHIEKKNKLCTLRLIPCIPFALCRSRTFFLAWLFHSRQFYVHYIWRDERFHTCWVFWLVWVLDFVFGNSPNGKFLGAISRAYRVISLVNYFTCECSFFPVIYFWFSFISFCRLQHGSVSFR